MTSDKNKLRMYEKQDRMSTFFNDNPFVHWIRQNSNNLFYAFLALIAALVIMYKSGNNKQVQSQTDFFAAEKTYQKLLKNVGEDSNKESFEESFLTLKHLLADHPELNEKYAAPLTQLLLIENVNSDIFIFADDVLSRTRKNELPVYQKFSDITLLITNKELEAALVQSKALSELLEKQDQTEPDYNNIQHVRYYNLIRTAFLAEQLGLKEEALTSWSKVKESLYSSADENNSVKLFFKKLFSDGNITLESFLENQIQSLEKSLAT